MTTLDLASLQRGDRAAWDEAFQCLWPVVAAVAHSKLGPYLPQEVEDVAIESLEEMIEQSKGLKSIDEVKPLVASIAHHRSVDRLRRHFAAKRGSGQVESVEAKESSSGKPLDASDLDTPLDALQRKELADVLQKLLAELKPPQGEILSDFYLKGLGYEEIARRRGVAVGSVGVYLKRGLEAMGRLWPRNPK